MESTAWNLSVSLASHVSTHLLIHLSAHLYYHHHSHHPSLLHSFTPGSKSTFSTNPSHLRLLLSTGLPSWQWDWTGPIMLIVLFLVSHFNFLFVPCGGLSWLPVSFLLYVKYTVSYRIVWVAKTSKMPSFDMNTYPQWQKRLWVCVHVKGGHFKHLIWFNSSHMLMFISKSMILC